MNINKKTCFLERKIDLDYGRGGGGMKHLSEDILLIVMMFAWMQAISTYNYLIEEGRVVAAALIPPLYVK